MQDTYQTINVTCPLSDGRAAFVVFFCCRKGNTMVMKLILDAIQKYNGGKENA